MYNTHFGFREKPFKLVPNPDFLYLSKSHELALAHLSYATDQGDGFVVITGEVGTGKTTLCRIFLEKLDKQIESAYIFNPKLDSVQLLTAICNEFGIRTNLKTVKELLDVINGYLIMKNQAGRKVILLIDEAQNLTVENLEMIRMLSNLETTRSKLLQIILVGQPELGDKLDSYELRQLAQRISLSCHLTPLNARETEGYIYHRINIAAQRQLPLFTSSACRQIHRYANGIPRLINIACDRALLAAYGMNRKKVTPDIVKSAIRELSAHRGTQTPSIFFNKFLIGTLLLIFLSAVGIAGFLIYKHNPFGAAYKGPKTNANDTSLTGPKTISNGSLKKEPLRTFKVPQAPVELSEFKSASEPIAPLAADMVSGKSNMSSERHLEEIIGMLTPMNSREHAAASLLTVWQQPQPNTVMIPQTIPDQDYFEIAARQYGLRLLSIEDDWELVKNLNIPAIISLKKNSSMVPVYLTLVSWENDQLKLTDGNQKNLIEIPFNSLRPYLDGQTHIFWRNIFGFDEVISQGSDHRAVLRVKELLHKIGYKNLGHAPYFDQFTKEAVIDFQGRYGLKRDGLVGPLTKIFLIIESNAYNFPVLDRENETGI